MGTSTGMGAGKGGGKDNKSSPAALSLEEQYRNWAINEKYNKKNKFFPNSPESPNGK